MWKKSSAIKDYSRRKPQASQNPSASGQTPAYTQACRLHAWWTARGISNIMTASLWNYKHTEARGWICFVLCLLPTLHTVPKHNRCLINKLKKNAIIYTYKILFPKAHYCQELWETKWVEWAKKTDERNTAGLESSTVMDMEIKC